MTSVLLQPNQHGIPGGTASREWIVRSLPASDAAKIPRCKDPNGFVVYGKDGTGRDGPGWNRLAPGDPVLFYHARRYFARGRVAHKLVSRQLADALWPKDGAEHDHIILIDGVVEVDLPAHRLHKAIGYKPGHVIQGFTVLKEDQARRAQPMLEQLRPMRASMSTQQMAAGELDYDDDVAEGRQVLVRHLVRERNRSLIRRKKEEVLRRTGALVCEACDFDFQREYAWLEMPWCEVHHNRPLAQSKGKQKTRLEDLSILCANCHRMIHKTHPMLSVAQFRRRFRAAKRTRRR